ncbi:MAG: Fe-S cluster assembly protein HesB [Acidobacteria bacterium]|nr:MAG: Fe-S cluster assembly protein HesB [Acidobacteriota bacterium]
MNIPIPTPRDFSFRRTALSHGWYDLPPFSFDRDTWTLTRVLDIDNGAPVTVKITATPHALNVHVARQPSQRTVARIVRDVRHALRLDDDMQTFYGAVTDDPDFTWIVRQGAGRLLRSPTVFEDLVKTICTTNCSWALTDKMVRELVNNLGQAGCDGARAFPTPAAMAAVPVSFYRDVMRSGYRAPYFKELAERVAADELDPESWLTSELPTPELKRAMKRVKGVGDYAAENLLKLVGRYDVLALDSWVRGKFARLHNRNRPATDKKIARHYARFNTWRGLALWCDMTKDWLEGNDE